MDRLFSNFARYQVRAGASFSRRIEFDRSGVDVEARTVPAVITTASRIEEFPGLFLTLSHKKKAVDLSRAEGGLPLHFNHDVDNWIGAVHDIQLKRDRTVGILRFAEHDAGAKVFNGVADGFLRSVSAMGPIHDIEPDENEDGFVATRWSLYEASVVTVPKDSGARIGRARNLAAEFAARGISEASPEWAEKIHFPKATLDAILRGYFPAYDQETLEAIGSVTGAKVDDLIDACARDGVLIKRSKQGGSEMDPNRTDPPNSGGNNDGANVVLISEARRAALEEGRRIGAEQENARQTEIRALFSRFAGRDVEALRDDCIRAGHTIERSRELLLESLGSGQRPVSAGDAATSSARGILNQAGEDQVDKFGRAARLALWDRGLLLRTPEEKKDARGNELRGYTLFELARTYLERIGVSTRGMDRMKLVGQAFIRIAPGQSTSDFANLLADTANKAAGIGYDDAPESWRGFCRIGSLSDFKVGDRPVLSLFDNLDEVPESGEYKYGAFGDKKETIQLATYGKLWSISRKAIINDDLQQLTRAPQKMGAAAARVPGDLVYNNILLGNPTMNEDGVALFNAAHSNFVAGGAGAAPSVATIEAARTAMATQSDPGSKLEAGKTIGVRLAHIIVPEALRSTANVLREAEFDPAGTAGTLTPNTVRGTFAVHSDHRIDANDAAKWFAAADPSSFDTIEVAFLDGNDAPFLEEDSPITVDGLIMKVRLDVGASPLDFRGLYHNDGN